MSPDDRSPGLARYEELRIPAIRVWAGVALLEPCHRVDGPYVERQLGSQPPHHCDASYRRAIADAIGVIDAMNSRRSVNGPLLEALRRQLESLPVERSEASGQ